MAGTWDEPGRCPKDDYQKASVRWVHTGNEAGVSVGYLRATCGRCGYQWNIEPADGISVMP